MKLPASLALIAWFAGCAPEQAGLEPRLNVAVAPLTLPGVGRICYDLRVTDGPTQSSPIVWAEGVPGLNGGSPDSGALCSSNFGNGTGGDITFVGACVATPTDSGQTYRTNSVTLWIDGIYDASNAYVSPTGPDGWQNPCSAGCTLTAPCSENSDTSVEFNLTILRQANQGFFDIGVNFEDIFCSAKLDCGDSLIFDPQTRVRIPTAVVGFACTAGPGATQTELWRSPLRVTCSTGSVDLDPALGPGQVYGNLIADPAPTDAVRQYAIYAGREQLSCGGVNCQKMYWNAAIGLDPTRPSCTLTAEATAAPAGALVDGKVPTNKVWPYVSWNVALTSAAGALACADHPLNGSPGGVSTTYSTLGQGLDFEHGFDGDDFLGGQTGLVTSGLLLHVDASNPASYLSGASTWFDLTAAHRNLSLVNNPTYASTDGGGVVFNGTSQYATAAPIEPSVFTITAWFKATGIPSVNDNFGGILVVSSPQLYLGTVQYAMSHSWLDQRVTFTVHGNSVSIATPNGAVLRNTLYQATATFDGSMRRLYIDGVLAAQGAWSQPPIYPTTGDRNVQIGRWGYSGWSRHFNGLIHEVLMYDRALSDAEVMQNYQATKTRYGR